jgi:hypothetical protein
MLPYSGKKKGLSPIVDSQPRVMFRSTHDDFQRDRHTGTTAGETLDYRRFPFIFASPAMDELKLGSPELGDRLGDLLLDHFSLLRGEPLPNFLAPLSV